MQNKSKQDIWKKFNTERKRKNVTYREARVYLDEMSKYGSVLGLETIRGLLRELGNPGICACIHFDDIE